MDKSIKVYIRNLAFPVLWLVLMTAILAIGIVPRRFADYFFMLDYGGLFVYFVYVKKDFNLKVFLSDFAISGFWKNTLLCVVLLAAAYGIGTLPAVFFPDHNIIFIKTSFMRAYNLPTLIAFFFSGFLFPGLGQELFYRKAMIRFGNKKEFVLSLLVGSLLFAINDSLDLFGIFRSFLVGLAFAFPYIKTRNINPSIFAHYFVSITMTLLFWRQ